LTEKKALVYVTYNSAKAIRENLPNLIRFGGETFAIYAVDNGSYDSSVIQLWSMGICPIVNGEFKGYTVAANQGIDWALQGKAEWILLVDPEVKPLQRHWVRQLTDVPLDCGIVGARLVNETAVVHAGGEITTGLHPFLASHGYQFGDKFLWCNENIGLTRLRYRNGPLTSFRQMEMVPFVSFAVVAIRRPVFETIGLLNEQYWHYCSNFDFCLRALTFGWKVCYNPVEFDQGNSGLLNTASLAMHNRGHIDVKKWMAHESEWLKRLNYRSC